MPKNMVSVPAGKPDASTVNGASAKGGKQGSISGKLAAAPAGNGAELGGKVVGFGSGMPAASTINGRSANGAGQGSVSGHLAAAPSTKDGGKGVKGFTGGGIKPGKI